ncbi:MAG: ABC transporter substrate-binding protein [Methanotrichaceae archaeon]
MIGCIDKFQTTYIIGRKDRGIVNVSDLKGKKIGVHRGGGIGEFYLGRFLDLHGISMQNVTLVDIPPSQWVQAITNGSVDALVGGAYIDQIQKRLGSNIVLWPAQSNQSGYWVMSCRGGWAASHPEQITRLLKSLDQAEVYTINHPDVVKAIVQKRMNYTERYMAIAWPDHQFSLSLDQSVALAIISASVISTNQQVERLNKQEELAKNIELKVGELSYLSNDYLLYHESQQIDRWESKYSSFSEDASNLTVDGSDQQVLVNNIKANGQRLKDIFGDVVSSIESAPSLQQNTDVPGFIHV